MRGSVVAGVVGCSIGLITAAADAQAPAAAFPPDPKPSAQAPAVAPPLPAEPPPAAPAPDARPVPPAPVPLERSAVHVAPPALAQAPEPPKAPPNWDVGAGVFSAGDLTMFTQSSATPSYNAALERRLGDRSWLALNLRFSYESREISPLTTNTDGTPTATQRINMTRVGALLGLRYVFVQGLVDVSGLSAVFAGSTHVSDGQLKAIGALGQSGGGSGRDLGLLLGLAVERELIERLALRLSLDLATVSISSDDASQLDAAGVERHTSLGTERVTLGVQPALQLYFYF